jgi:hypothetical protein
LSLLTLAASCSIDTGGSNVFFKSRPSLLASVYWVAGVKANAEITLLTAVNIKTGKVGPVLDD